MEQTRSARPHEEPGVNSQVQADVRLEELVEELNQALGEYDRYFGRLLGETEIAGAGDKVGRMETAALRMYPEWQTLASSLPSRGDLVDLAIAVRRGLALRDRLYHVVRLHLRRALARERAFERLIDLNENIRRATDRGHEVLVPLRRSVLDAHHYLTQCERLFRGYEHPPEELQLARERAGVLDQIIRLFQADVDAQRAQTESLALFAQTQSLFQLRRLNWILLGVTAAAVIAWAAR